MATKQTRRSISVAGVTYERLAAFAGEHGRSISDVIEELIAELLHVPKPESRKGRRPGQPGPTPAAPTRDRGGAVLW